MSEIIFTALLLIFILWVLFSHNKTRGRLSRSVNMAVFGINDPKNFIEQGGLNDVFKNLSHKNWNRWLFGEPYIALEKVFTPSGLKYYLAVPANSAKAVENRLGLSKVEKAHIPQNKFYSAAYLNYPPRKINFEAPKLHEEEGATLQVLLRPRINLGLESNLELLTWAGSPARARKVLAVKHESRALFDFFHRIFENKKRVRISFDELKQIFLT